MNKIDNTFRGSIPGAYLESQIGNEMKSHTQLPNFTFYAYTDSEGKVIGVHLTLHDNHIDQFRNILSRALNCAPSYDPQYDTWFELADLLEGREETKGTAQKD